MRRRRTLLAPDEVERLERAVGIDVTSSGTHHTVTIRNERSQFAAFVWQLPEGGRITVALVVLACTSLALVMGGLFLATLLPAGGPPPSCIGHGGVNAVKVGTDNTYWSGMVICKDGTSYTN